MWYLQWWASVDSGLRNTQKWKDTGLTCLGLRLMDLTALSDTSCGTWEVNKQINFKFIMQIWSSWPQHILQTDTSLGERDTQTDSDKWAAGLRMRRLSDSIHGNPRKPGESSPLAFPRASGAMLTSQTLIFWHIHNRMNERECESWSISEKERWPLWWGQRMGV